MLQPDDAVLITSSDRLHRVGFVVSVYDGGVIVQPTAFDGSSLQSPDESRHSVLERDVARLREIPQGRGAGSFLLEQAGGGGVIAAQLIAPAVDGKWTATIGLYVRNHVVGGHQSIDLMDWQTPCDIADAIDEALR